MSEKLSLTSPVLLESSHCVDDFDCGNPELNHYIQRFAFINNQHGAARTFVAVRNNKIAGYHTLTIGSVSKDEAPQRISQGLAKHPVPVVIVARLAVDKRFHGKGIGQALLKNALLRIARAADEIGGRAVLVHAKNDEAKAFYLKFGFEPSPTDRFHLYLLMKDIKKTIQN
ncbi:MAG: GNAT family N-acetyltransferase [Candidatus Omnitrophota bacterium]